MWATSRPEPTLDEVTQLLRWGRAQRISLDYDDFLSLDDEDLFTYTTRRTRPRYKSERRHLHRERDER
jgi:hypothetical protein